MRALLRRFVRGRRAAAAVEFALLGMFLLLLAGGVVELGAVLRAYSAVSRLTMQYANSYFNCGAGAVSCATDMANYTAATTIANVAPQLHPDKLTITMIEVQVDPNAGTVTVLNSQGVNALTDAQTAAVLALVPTTAVYDVVVVSLSYQYSLIAFSQLMAPFIGNSLPIAFSTMQLSR